MFPASKATRTLISILSATLLFACGQSAPDSDGAADSAAGINVSDIEALLARGEDIYFGTGECWDCHGNAGEGNTAPSLLHAPSAFDIQYMLETNPEMGDVAAALDASSEDVVATAAYVRTLANLDVNAGIVDELVASLASARDYSFYASADNFVITPRDELIQQVEGFDTVLADWERKSATGNIMHTYDIRSVRTYDAGRAQIHARRRQGLLLRSNRRRISGRDRLSQRRPVRRRLDARRSR